MELCGWDAQANDRLENWLYLGSAAFAEFSRVEVPAHRKILSTFQ